MARLSSWTAAQLPKGLPVSHQIREYRIVRSPSPPYAVVVGYLVEAVTDPIPLGVRTRAGVVLAHKLINCAGANQHFPRQIRRGLLVIPLVLQMIGRLLKLMHVAIDFIFGGRAVERSVIEVGVEHLGKVVAVFFEPLQSVFQISAIPLSARGS